MEVAVDEAHKSWLLHQFTLAVFHDIIYILLLKQMIQETPMFKSWEILLKIQWNRILIILIIGFIYILVQILTFHSLQSLVLKHSFSVKLKQSFFRPPCYYRAILFCLTIYEAVTGKCTYSSGSLRGNKKILHCPVIK